MLIKVGLGIAAVLLVIYWALGDKSGGGAVGTVYLNDAEGFQVASNIRARGYHCPKALSAAYSDRPCRQ